MAIYYLTGGLGSGKTKVAVLKIKEMLNKGLWVATNIDLNLEHILKDVRNKDAKIYRLPDKPSVDDLKAIGFGYDVPHAKHYDESKFGGLFLDELGTWFNSRDWNDKGRRELINHLLHLRKKRWHFYAIIQDMELLDNQARAATAKQFVVERRDMSNYSVPVLSPIFKFITGFRLQLDWFPFMTKNMAIVRVGLGQKASVADRWRYNDPVIHDAYDTTQEFYEPDSPEACALYSYLPTWYLKGRFLPVKNFEYYKKESSR